MGVKSPWTQVLESKYGNFLDLVNSCVSGKAWGEIGPLGGGI